MYLIRYWLATTVLRPPLRAFYIACLLLWGIALYAHYPQPHSLLLDEITEESAPEIYLEEFPLLEDETAAVTKPTAAPLPSKPAWLEYRVRRGDTMESVLRAIHTDNEMRNYLFQQKMKSYRRLRIGDTVYFQQDENGNLQRLLYKTSPEYYFSAGRDESGNFWAKEEAPVTQTIRRQHSGTIKKNSSLFPTAAAVGMSDRASAKLVQVLETQIDLHRNVRENDTFRVIYDTVEDEQGDEVAVKNIAVFEYDSNLESRPRLIRGVYYQNDDISGYYTPEGESLQHAFLPAPLKYSRISSRFSKNRFHPVLKRWRAHRGVDYAARSGTPVHSTADGVVSLVARQRGYGNLVMIKHYDIYTTVYAHLRAFKKGIKKGKRVQQGEVIGYVGQTGLATGPHLHYEFRVRGKHKNPLSEAIPKQLPPLKGDVLQRYREYSQPLFAELEKINPQ